MGYKFECDDEAFELTPDNAVVNLFRHYPYYDHITYTEPEQKPIALYSAKLARWLGGVALTPDTQSELRRIEAEMGVYGEQFGYPRVIIDDHPTEYEYDMLAKVDLDHIEDWINGN